MQTLLWSALGLGLSLAVIDGLSNSGHSVVRAQPPEQQSRLSYPIDQPTLPPEEAMALRGTRRLDHAEEIDGIGGNPEAIIDQKQYDEIVDYLASQIAATPAKRDKIWRPSFSSTASYDASVSEHRKHLRNLLGLILPTTQQAEIKVLHEGGDVRVEQVLIPIGTGFHAQALLFLPRSSGRKAAVIALPPADQSAEDFAGITESGTPAKWLTALLQRDVAVAVPEMEERLIDHPLCHQAGEHDRRRLLWRLGFLVGRTLVGLDVQQVMATADYLSSTPGIDAKRIAVLGDDQGGMTALYAAAVDERLAGAAVVDYFQQREGSWKEPVDRVIYGQLNEFGDAEVAALIAPRPLSILTSSGGSIPLLSVHTELDRAVRFYKGLGIATKLVAREETSDAAEVGAEQAAAMLGPVQPEPTPSLEIRISKEQVEQARNAHFEEVFQYLHGLCMASDEIRENYWKLASTPPSDRPKKIAKLRSELANLEGVIPTENVPLNPRTLLIAETDKILVYDVLVDVVSGMEAYGRLVVPRSVSGRIDQKLPAMICQHGLSGHPIYISGVGTHLEKNDLFYNRFGERLAERGYVVFAPYLTSPGKPQTKEEPAKIHGYDLINVVTREAACLGMMRIGIDLAKLHRIVDFLQSLPFVDGDRIGYYGLSYGGHAGLWMPPLEPRIKFTLVSGYFTDWRSTELGEPPPGYWHDPDEDVYNWNALNRFTHPELIAAMWPRPAGIEYGLFDPTAPEVRHKRAEAQLNEIVRAWGWEDKIMDDHFIGPHTIHGIGTFSFIDRWLRPERPAGRDYSANCCDDAYCYKEVSPGLHGYVQSSNATPPYVTQLLDSDHATLIWGRFYVASASPEVTGMALKMSRTGHPGNLLVRLGSHEGASDIGEARVRSEDVYTNYDLWYGAKLPAPHRLDPTKLYWFEITAETGRAPQDCYTVYGPRPLGGKDYPQNFGLSFRMLTRAGK